MSAPTGPPLTRDVARTWKLLSGFRYEQSDPARYYTMLAADSASLLADHLDLAGATVVDIGGGPGYTAAALRARGAAAFTLDAYVDELELHDRVPELAVAGDGQNLPIGDGVLDAACTFNVLEHVPNPWAFLAELTRVTRPGGIVFVGVTNWLSPWGGHETSPWHWLGGRKALDRFDRKHPGQPAKNRFGESLHPVHIAEVLRWAEACPDVDVVDAFPRYYPSWARPLVRIPGVREVASWNLAIVLRVR
ncbi:class I SAM-dependent methyltransferase [Aquihabitans sp. G128]|uniref:class I SAM-dependent methyltransferase n=1 Tax=Aquihabitans sp. G128 TaxID=2849779 RepID=UPI001C22285A|nr:class I SAM-dependent methyltransferase [Aquihabitans sp. G128]QXC60406.1 class I SAM-dependent methyltransferase [Aquihabitans sp. G128]